MKRDKIGDDLLQSAGQSPVAYSAMPDIRLRPGMAANAAARLILRHLLEMMRANEAGIKADADIEFLHEYRVAVRRTRSALSQIRKVFPPEKTEHFRREFQTLGRRTNDLRNLDVFLTTEAGYRARLPSDMRGDIAPLFDYLRSCRAEALALVVAGLESESYSHFLDEWDRFLQQPIGENDPGNAFVPIIELARGRIDRQYRNIVKDGAYALEHTEDKLLHALRIECKKLRYLLEFFAGLFPPEDVNPLLKALKRLQDNLGALADLSDQRDYLLSIAEMLDIDGTRARRALVATGFLVENIAREQQSLRTDFSGIFKGFASPAHERQFQKLIGRRKRG
jgi:CHAD domain-containing protein